MEKEEEEEEENTSPNRSERSNSPSEKASRQKSAELTANNQTFRSDSRSIFLFLFFLSSTRKSHTPANNEQIIRGIYSQKKKRTKKDFLFFFSRAVISFLLTIVLSGAQFKSKKRNWSICHRCRQ